MRSILVMGFNHSCNLLVKSLTTIVDCVFIFSIRLFIASQWRAFKSSVLHGICDIGVKSKTGILTSNVCLYFVRPFITLGPLLIITPQLSIDFVSCMVLISAP
uniref:ORF17 n=1 Tax=Malaco herpesvirus 1 TaxID=3031797 RepID=A0AA48SF25_9VIRU|nr:TPA_asm: ORF17 [Malaco herpesvirus 1]